MRSIFGIVVKYTGSGRGIVFRHYCPNWYGLPMWCKPNTRLRLHVSDSVRLSEL